MYTHIYTYDIAVTEVSPHIAATEVSQHRAVTEVSPHIAQAAHLDGQGAGRAGLARVAGAWPTHHRYYLAPHLYIYISTYIYVHA